MLTNTERQQIVEEVNAGTYGIDEALDDIAEAQKGEEVRKALYAEALVLNREGHAGSTDMIARQQIANLQTSVNGQISTLRTEVGDDIDDLETALNSGLATQNGRIAAQNATIANVVANYNVEYGSTELWASTGETGALAAGTTVTLSEDVSHFDYIDIYSFCGNSNVLDTVPVDAKLQSSAGYALRWVNLSDPDSGSYKAYVRIIETRLHIIGTTLTIDHQVTYRNGEEVNISGAEITQSNRSTYVGELGIMKVVGRKITANTEIEDVRIGADGTEYNSAGQAVRAQVTALESAIPAVDSTLSTQGAAADAKVVGELLANMEKLSPDVTQLKADLADVKGNTKNLCDVSVFGKGNVTVADGIVTGTAADFNNAFKSASGGVPVGIEWKENTQYTVSFLAKNNTGGATTAGFAINFVYTDGTSSSTNVPNNITDYSARTFTSTAGKTVSMLTMGYVSEGTYVWNLKDIQIEEGATKTEYIPHITATDHVAREEIAENYSEVSTRITEHTAQINEVNCWNDFSVNYPATTKNGVTVSMNDGVLSASGAASNATTYWDLYSGNISPTGLIPGKTYVIDLGLHGEKIDGYINMYTNSGSGNVLLLNKATGIVKATIPSGAQTVIFRYFAPNSPVNFLHRITFTETMPNAILTNFAEMRFLRAWGTGDCTIIKFKNGETLVIDFGLNEGQGTLQSSWNTAISQMGITHIDYAIISHYHSDHIGMLLAGIGNLIDSDTVFFTAPQYTAEQLDGLAWMDSMSGNTVVQDYTSVQTVLDNANVKRVYPAEGDVVHIGNADIQFWNCDHTEFLNQYIAHTMYDYNPCSLCNYIAIGTQRMCFSGDINVAVMEKYQKSVLPSQIFKVNHHSAGYAVVPLFLNSLMPELDITMLGHPGGTLSNSPNQIWCENNFVPNIVTGVNEKTLILSVSDNGYSWQNSVRKLIRTDEGWTA